MITLIAVGKKHESWVQAGVERYEKRLRAPFDVKWVLLPHSSKEGDSARQEESERILKRLGSDAYVVLLDERGKQFSSPQVSAQIETVAASGRPVTVIIGGAFGVDASIHQRADLVLSFSPMVFPHQLVRLMLVEQLYRAQSIATGGKYHHE